MSWPRNERPVEQVFLIDFAGDCEAVARLLGVFAVQGCRLAGLSLASAAPHRRLRVEIAGLEPERAEHLRRRLQAVPLVHGVSLGWREAAPLPVP